MRSSHAENAATVSFQAHAREPVKAAADFEVETVGLVAVLKASSVEGKWLLWTFGDGTTEGSAEPIVVHRYSESGTYTVTLQVESDSGYTEIVHTIPVYTLASPSSPPASFRVDWGLVVAVVGLGVMLVSLRLQKIGLHQKPPNPRRPHRRR
ncbi:MAG: PKD domain-containing protein [Halobacteriales archaeon]|nr:PKD domain-containing protein [Halobacteriales archaeon]